MQLDGDEKVDSLLAADSLDRWSGLLVDYYVAPPTDRRQFLIGHPCLCLLASGRTWGTIRSGVHMHEVHAAEGVMNLYGPQVDITRAIHSAADSRRIVVELPLRCYRSLGLEDELSQVPLGEHLAVSDAEAVGILRAMVEEIMAGCPHGRLYAEALSQGLLRHLHQRYSARGAGSCRSNLRLTPSQFAKLVDFIRSHLDRNIGIVDLAREAGVSPSNLVRMFRNTVLTTPHQFLIGERVHKAKTLLAGSDASLVEIALLCGFSSQAHFGTLFKRETGMTPVQFRKSSRSGGVLPRRGAAIHGQGHADHER